MKAIIKSPVKDYMGVSASVAFADGKAEADISESQLDYFESAGYTVEILEAPKVAKNKADAKDTKEAESEPEVKTEGK
jgi:hypothetical protein|nr:MAG TPA: hypothetical protein [Caudoviricetes sp.]